MLSTVGVKIVSVLIELCSSNRRVQDSERKMDVNKIVKIISILYNRCKKMWSLGKP
jgi:hypothetical protein